MTRENLVAALTKLLETIGGEWGTYQKPVRFLPGENLLGDGRISALLRLATPAEVADESIGETREELTDPLLGYLLSSNVVGSGYIDSLVLFRFMAAGGSTFTELFARFNMDEHPIKWLSRRFQTRVIKGTASGQNPNDYRTVDSDADVEALMAFWDNEARINGPLGGYLIFNWTVDDQGQFHFEMKLIHGSRYHTKFLSKAI